VWLRSAIIIAVGCLLYAATKLSRRARA
jgi:APA family basic amino acid/polyamine antiporter